MKRTSVRPALSPFEISRKLSDNTLSIENHYGPRKMLISNISNQVDIDPFVEYLVKNDLIRCAQISQKPKFVSIVDSMMALEKEINQAKKKLKNGDASHYNELGPALLDFHKNAIERKKWILKQTGSLLGSV